MRPAPARARTLLAAAALAIIAYAASTSSPAGPLLALMLCGVGVLVTSRWVGLAVPRLVVGVATLGVVLSTVQRAIDDGLSVHDFSYFVVWMIVIKSFDRRQPGDDAQLLAYSVFLAVASMLLSNGLVVAMLTLVYLPFVAHAAMHLQLRMSLDKAQRFARRRVEDPARVPSVRSAAGASAGRALGRTSAVALLLGFAIAAIVFIVVPRGAGLRQIGQWGNPGAGRVVSFADRVRVGTGGAISTNRTPVLHMRLSDSNGNDLGGFGSVRYLRGAVLDTYADGTWTSSKPPFFVGEPNHAIAGETFSLGGAGGESMLYQDILLLNTPRDFTYLFTLWRPSSVQLQDPAVYMYHRPTGTAMVTTNGGKFRYIARSSPYDHSFVRKDAREPASWPSLIVGRVAAEILAEPGVEPDPALRPIGDDSLAINAFRQFFWNRYTYSLGEPPPPRGVEPIEWFLTEADRGHCEHYASALAALCRSVGIPARVVTGYLAAEYNRSTGAYLVRESNAHAWVEAQIEPGVWRTYDATPPSELLAQHGPAKGAFAGLGRALDTLNYRWVNSIVSFDSGARSDLLGWSQPATGAFSEKAGTVLAHLRVAQAGEIVSLALRLFLVMVAVVGVVWGLGVLVRRRLAAWARRPRAMPRRIADPAIRGRVRATPIYQEMLTTLARAGFAKPDWQPVRAWGESLSARSGAMSAAVTELSDLFYIVRFGGRDLTPVERARAEALLLGLAGQSESW